MRVRYPYLIIGEAKLRGLQPFTVLRLITQMMQDANLGMSEMQLFLEKTRKIDGNEALITELRKWVSVR